MRNILNKILALTCFSFVPALNAADISFGGYLLNRTDWRDPASPKHEPTTNQNVDLDADGMLGTEGYILFGPAGQEIGKFEIGKNWLQQVTKNQPEWIEKIEILSPAEMGRFSGYALIDHPETAGEAFVSGALSVESRRPEHPVLRLTFGEGVPQNVRVG